MRSRKNDYTMDCREVHDRVGAVVQQHVQLQDYGYKCRSSVLLNVLFFAVFSESAVNLQRVVETALGIAQNAARASCIRKTTCRNLNAMDEIWNY